MSSSIDIPGHDLFKFFENTDTFREYLLYATTCLFMKQCLRELFIVQIGLNRSKNAVKGFEVRRYRFEVLRSLSDPSIVR